jgi:hypothetical protein
MNWEVIERGGYLVTSRNGPCVRSRHKTRAAAEKARRQADRRAAYGAVFAVRRSTANTPPDGPADGREDAGCGE